MNAHATRGDTVARQANVGGGTILAGVDSRTAWPNLIRRTGWLLLLLLQPMASSLHCNNKQHQFPSPSVGRSSDIRELRYIDFIGLSVGVCTT
jgi:hypothetical protein